MVTKTKESSRPRQSGKLRIGDDWNAISIIALSQSNPLKAVAEFVENSIDAGARNVTIVRGREKGKAYLRITDDGDGVPRDDNGVPNFKYVATHVCDSIKRRLKQDARAEGIQGEFGIGLLSFWTVGEQLTLACPAEDGQLYEMSMSKDSPGYSIARKRRLISGHGTELTIKPLLPGIRNFSGEKLQWYLASELRDRIRSSGINIRIIDRQARAEFTVEPRQYTGRLLHALPVTSTAHGDVYTELYLAAQEPANQVGLYRGGTRVLEDITELDEFRRPPWTSGYLQGIVDAPFLNITPGTRLGVVHDARFAEFTDALAPLEEALLQILKEQQQAEEERTSRQTLRSIQKALREALLTLPEEEYDWFDIGGRGGKDHKSRSGRSTATQDTDQGDGGGEAELAADAAAGRMEVSEPEQKQFFEHPGPLHSVRISPASCVVPIGQSKNLRAVPRDRRHLQVEENLQYVWRVAEGMGSLENADGEIATFHAPGEPMLTRIELQVSQDDITCTAEALVTVTDSLVDTKKDSVEKKGLPSYTFQNAAGQLWRSRYDKEKNLIVINKGHRDFVYSSRSKALKLRYICRLFAKELVYHNFPGYSGDQLLERMVELSLYAEEHLREQQIPSKRGDVTVIPASARVSCRWAACACGSTGTGRKSQLLIQTRVAI